MDLVDLGSKSPTWRDVLEKCLKDLKRKFPSFTESQIADEIKIPRATLNRIYNENKKPRLDNFIKILLSSGNKLIFDEALEIFDPEIAKEMRKVMSVRLKYGSFEIASDEFNRLRKNKEIYIAYLLCMMTRGATPSVLKEVLGSNWENPIKILIENNIVVEIGSRYKLVLGTQSLTTSFEIIKKNAGFLLDFHSAKHVGKDRNYIFIVNNGLNKDGISKMQELYREFHQKLQSLISNPSYIGEIPAFAIGCMDSLTEIKQGEEV